MESKCFRDTVVPCRREPTGIFGLPAIRIRSPHGRRLNSLRAQIAPAAFLESWRGNGNRTAQVWSAPCFTAHVGSQLTAWENLEDCMPTGKIKMFDEGRGFGFIKSDDGGVDVFFHVSALRDGDKITQGKAVKFEIGVDPKSGKTKAVSVDLT
jgi:cold shock protein